MTHTLQLSSERLRCEIAPALGGCIVGLWLGELPVLRSQPAAQLATSRQSASYPLVPYSNRIAQALLQWQGQSYPLAANNPPEPHAIHGVGWQQPWQVLAADAQSARLAYQHLPDAAWPFAFASTQEFRLTPDALELRLSLSNQAGQPVPAGLGWHPFFVKRPGSHIAFQAQGRWEMGEDKLPTRRASVQGLDTDCASLDLDHCFDGWDGLVQLRDEALRMRIRSDLGCLVVFTNGARDTVAIEPVSHVNNAANLVAAGQRAEDLGLRVLQPGETMSAQMRIEVEAVR
ncbi:aldose 1-epimerase [Ramlibacter sp. 2FC]|uniref:aldose 1-epimerase n=1 Tax=Ramlibacter sp. 2FC TaxID=2502188 RepID=UPI0010F942D7|nr:aldose 1-epimerase [Ramlibacter sp. 2FC]